MNLLIDIGNTRIKWCTASKEKLEKVQPIEYKTTDFEKELQQYWSQLETPDLLAVSSVGCRKISSRIINLAKNYWPAIKVFKAKSSTTALSVTNAYPHPEKLGIDRWLGLIALHHYYPGNACIADCGSAITVDCLNKSGKHLGGIINPGLHLMKQCLLQETEQLPYTDQHYAIGLSNSTESAIYTGTLYAAVGIMKKVISDFSNCKTFVLTGGDASLIAKFIKLESLKVDIIVEPDFILKGLALFCTEQNSS